MPIETENMSELLRQKQRKSFLTKKNYKVSQAKRRRNPAHSSDSVAEDDSPRARSTRAAAIALFKELLNDSNNFRISFYWIFLLWCGKIVDRRQFMICSKHGLEMEYTTNKVCPLCEMLTESSQKRLRERFEQFNIVKVKFWAIMGPYESVEIIRYVPFESAKTTEIVSEWFKKHFCNLKLVAWTSGDM